MRERTERHTSFVSLSLFPIFPITLLKGVTNILNVTKAFLPAIPGVLHADADADDADANDCCCSACLTLCRWLPISVPILAVYNSAHLTPQKRTSILTETLC